MQRSIKLYILCLLIIGIIISGIGLFFIRSNNSQELTNMTILTSPATGKTIRFTQTATELPMSLNNPAIVRAAILYMLHGKIERVEKKDKGYLVITDIKNHGENVSFLADNRTVVQIDTNGKRTVGTPENLIPGKTIDIGAEYRINTGEWVPKVILVFMDSPSNQE